MRPAIALVACLMLFVLGASTGLSMRAPGVPSESSDVAALVDGEEGQSEDVPPALAPGQQPYSASSAPHALPGLIQAEDFDLGGEVVGYHDLTPANDGETYRDDGVDIKLVPDGSTVIGWFQSGEWLNYTVSLAEGGSFDVSLRTGSAYSPERTLSLSIDGTPIGRVTAPSIPDWDAPLSVVTLRGVSLPAGIHVLRLEVAGLDWVDVDWIQVTPADPTAQDALAAPAAVSPAPGDATDVAAPPVVAPPVCGAPLQGLVDAAPAGATIDVPACVFRETVVITRPVTLNGAGVAEIRGSDVWTDWAANGRTWTSHRTVPAFVNDRKVECVAERCHWPEQVFIDGRALEQLAANTTPGVGQFSLDAQRHIVLAQDPAGRTIEVTVRTRWVDVQADGVSIQGFSMRHAANEAQTGAIGNQSRSAFTLQDSALSDAHGAIISLGGSSNAKVVRNDISRAGQAGLSGFRNTDTLIQGNKIHANNTEGFKPEWEGGGLKIVAFSNTTIDNNEVYGNTGPGLWCDIGCRGITYSNNRVHDNMGPGIFFEISDGAEIVRNVIWNTGAAWPGISVSSSANASVHDNVLAWNPAGISVLSVDRPDRPSSGSIGNSVHNNTVVMKRMDGVALEWAQYGSGALFDGTARNAGWGNRYWYPADEDGNARFAWQGQRTRLSEFNGTPGGKDGRYVSSVERDQALASSGVPNP
jgi:Right handed beta helix region/Carbohydrate binding module (family 6)